MLFFFLMMLTWSAFCYEYKKAANKAKMLKPCLTFPLPFNHINQPGFYGYVYGEYWHGGNDYAISSGTEIRAALSGVVIKVIDDLSNTYPKDHIYGNVIYLLHDNGLITIYGHLNSGSIRAKLNQKISQGQVIARSDNSGYSTGPHLHFEVTIDGSRYNKGTPVDPYECNLWLLDFNGQPVLCKSENTDEDFLNRSAPLDYNGFRIIGIHPQKSDGDCDITTPIEITFSESIRDINEIGYNLIITPRPLVDIRVFSANQNRNLVTISGMLFKPKTDYTIKLKRQITSSSGQELLSGTNATFRTADWPHVLLADWYTKGYMCGVTQVSPDFQLLYCDVDKFQSTYPNQSEVFHPEQLIFYVWMVVHPKQIDQNTNYGMKLWLNGQCLEDARKVANHKEPNRFEGFSIKVVLQDRLPRGKYDYITEYFLEDKLVETKVLRVISR